MITKLRWGLPLIASIVATPAFADNDLNINGFLSVGASMLDDDKASIANSDNQGGFKNDTVLGLQVSKQINDSTTATGQLVSRGSDDYSTEAAWAFVSYAATDDIDIRMGRLRIPFFQYSDFLEVGYAYNWVRPPEEVYRLPFSSVDGIDLNHRFGFGPLEGNIQVYYGRFQGIFKYTSSTGADEEYNIDYRNFTGIALSTQYGNFGSRLSYHQAETILELNDPNASIARAAIAAAAVAQALNDPGAAKDFSFTGQTSQFFEAALTYDNGDISAVAEWTALEQGNSLFLDDQGWLVSAAKRMDDLTFHLTYSTQKSEYDSGNEGKIQKALPLMLEESSTTLGLRYDYDSGTALKFEIQNNDEKTINNADGDSVTLYSVAVDIVF